MNTSANRLFCIKNVLFFTAGLICISLARSEEVPAPTSSVGIGSDFLSGSAIICQPKQTILACYSTLITPIDRQVHFRPADTSNSGMADIISSHVRVLSVHPGYNLCLASITTGVVSSVSLPEGLPTVPPNGTPCDVVGYVGTLGYGEISPSRIVVEAAIVSNNLTHANLKYYALNTRLPFWFDGAAVYNRQKALIGIVTFQPDLGTNTTFVVPMLNLRASQFVSPMARNNQSLADACVTLGSKWLEAASATSLPPGLKQTYVNEACRCFAAEAVQTPQNPKPYVRIAQVLRLSGARRSAIKLFKHAIALNYDSARAYLLLGLDLIEEGRAGEAMDVLITGAGLLTREPEFAGQCVERCAVQMADLHRLVEASYFLRWCEVITPPGAPSKNAEMLAKMKKVCMAAVPLQQQTALSMKTKGFSKSDIKQFVLACGENLENRNRFSGSINRKIEYTSDSSLKAVTGIDRSIHFAYCGGLLSAILAEVHAPVFPLGTESPIAQPTRYEFLRNDEGVVEAIKFGDRIAQEYGYDDAGLLCKYIDSTSDLGGYQQISHYMNDACAYPAIRTFSNGSIVTQFLGAAATQKFTLVVQGTPRMIRRELTNGTQINRIVRPQGVPSTTFAFNTHFDLESITHGTDTWSFVRDTNTGRINERHISSFGVKDIYETDLGGNLMAERRSDNSRNIVYMMDAVKRIGYINDNIKASCPNGPQCGSINITLGEKLQAPLEGNVHQVPKLTALAIRAAMQEALSAATRTKPAKRQIVLLPDGILDEPLVLGPSEKNLISISDVIAPVIVQARPGAQCIVKQALTFQNLPMLEVRGIRLISSSGGSGLRIVNCKGAVLNSCIIVSGTIVFEGSLDTKCIGNTFDFTKGGSVCWKQSGNGFVRNCIFLGNGASTITFKESEPTLDYNCFFPQPPLNPGAHSLVVDPQLLPGSYALSGTNRLLGAGCPQTIAKWPADINGRYHNTKRPCIGAVTYATEQTIQDLGGAVIQRKICGRTYDYVYDGFLRLVEYIDRQNTTNNATYSYDSEGRRIGMTVGRSRYRFVYDKNNTRIEYVDWDGDGRVDRQRTYWTLDTPEDRLGFVEHTKAGPAFFYYLTDHAGSVLRIVDSDGRCVNQYDYDAYGNIDWRTSFETVENRYRFRGMDWDDHAKHYNTKGRIYIPEWGIYLAPDLKGSHVFVTGNPINRTSKSIE